MQNKAFELCFSSKFQFSSFRYLDAQIDLSKDCKITADGFSLSGKTDSGKVNIGLVIQLAGEGVTVEESNKYASDGFFEIKLRKSKPGLLKHYKMGKTRHALDVYRFDALISDRQVITDVQLYTYRMSGRRISMPYLVRVHLDAVTAAYSFALINSAINLRMQDKSHMKNPIL